MKLWRLTRIAHTALDGAGALRHGGRYSSPGRPVVPLASEAGAAVLVAMRYLPEIFAGGLNALEDEFVLGWTEADAVPERIPGAGDDVAVRAFVDEWLETRRSLLAAIPSAVLPEADVVLLNPLHPEAANVAPLTIRAFSFAECLHKPPMLDRFRSGPPLAPSVGGRGDL